MVTSTRTISVAIIGSEIVITYWVKQKCIEPEIRSDLWPLLKKAERSEIRSQKVLG